MNMVCYYNDETTNSKLNMEVYCLFETVGDGDTGKRMDILLGVFDSCESARLRAVSLLSSVDRESTSWWSIIAMEEMSDEEMKKCDYPLVHRTMNKDNNYIYIGQRDDCCTYIGYSAFGGYIIEPTMVESSPTSVDPIQKEEYLDNATFSLVFKMDRAAFRAMPKWKRDAAKKAAGLM